MVVKLGCKVCPIIGIIMFYKSCHVLSVSQYVSWRQHYKSINWISDRAWTAIEKHQGPLSVTI